MIFFFIMPILWSGFGNILSPYILYIDEVPYPRLNNLSLILILFAYLYIVPLTSLSQLSTTHTIFNGWTLYPPLSTSISSLLPYTVSILIISLLLSGYSSTFTSLNFLILLTHYRPSGILLLYMDLYLYAITSVSILLLVSLPFLTTALFLTLSDLCVTTSFFTTAPLLYQHLFWFFGHPEVYVLIIPGFGIITLTLRTSLSIAVFGSQCMSLSVLCIGFFGFLVWAHHMYTAGISIDSRIFFTLSTFLIAIPTSSKLFSISTTLFLQ